MSASIIFEKTPSEIQAAVAVSLLQLKNTHGLTYEQIGLVMGREKQSVAQYVSGTTDMPAFCWMRAIAKWPELEERLTHNLDDAEKDFQARQRNLNLGAAA